LAWDYLPDNETTGDMKEPATAQPELRPTRADVSPSPSDSGRLRVLLGLLALTAIVWACSRPYLASLKQKASVKAAGSPNVSKTDALLTAGMDMAQHRRWLEAVEIFDTAARSGADNATVHRALGRCLWELSWIQDAIQEYERAIQQEPTYFNTYINLATAYRTIGRRSDALHTLQRAEQALQSPQLMAAPQRYARPVAPMLEDLAEAYARAGEQAKSVEWSLRAQTADPTRTRGYMLAAKSYFVLKQAEKAIPLLQKACSVAPNDPDSHYTLALALRARPSEPHNLSAHEHLITAIQIAPTHAPALYQLGLLSMERKEWDKALAVFRKAYELQYEPGTLLWKAAQASRAKGDPVETAFFLGQYYEYIGQLDTALSHFQTLVGKPKYERIAYGSLARTQTKLGHYEAATATLGKAIALDPRSTELRRQLATVYEKLHIVTKRTAALQEAARIDAKEAHRDYYQLGRIALDVGNYEEAEGQLAKAIALAPQEAQYHYSLGQTLLLRAGLGDRLNQAITHLEEAQRLMPDNAGAHDFLSSAYVKAQRWQDAAVSLHRAANLAPQNQVLYFRLNQVYKRLGNEQEAKRAQTYYQRLRKQEVELDLRTRKVKARPKDPSAHFALGNLLLETLDYAAARRQFEKVLELNPNDARTHERLVTVYGELAQPERQLQHLRRFEQLSAAYVKRKEKR
jgi:tetratricopeptide (TPR) repeat protein